MRIGIALAVVFLCATAKAFDGIPGLLFDGNVRTFSRDAIAGYAIAVVEPVTITALGKFDANDNGTLDDAISPQVGIWNADTGALLQSVSLPLNTPLDHGAFHVPVSPLELNPGSYIFGAQTFAGQEEYILPARLEMLGGMHWLNARLRSGTDFQIPTRRLSSFGLLAPSFLIDEKLYIQRPSPMGIVQRTTASDGRIPVGGYVDPNVERVEARFRGQGGDPENDWTTIPINGNRFSGFLDATVGWHSVEVRVIEDDQVVASQLVDQVGVGDVFVVAGQSNAANHGLPTQTSTSGMVFAMDENGHWRPGNDPLPVATGSDGSPWPKLGDHLANALGVPIGFASVASGGTRVDEWQPDRALYAQLQDALQLLGPRGARAVLWHQGESDAFIGTSTESYSEQLRTVIEASRVDAGFDIPWGVARAAFLPDTPLEQEHAVIAGQQLVIDTDPLIFEGPLTDDLLGDAWRYDQVHFNQAGLDEHARRWADAILTHLIPEPPCAWMIGLVPAGVRLRSRASR